jgi:hypothetical protein
LETLRKGKVVRFVRLGSAVLSFFILFGNIKEGKSVRFVRLGTIVLSFLFWIETLRKVR